MPEVLKLIFLVVIAHIIHIVAGPCPSKNIKFYDELKCARIENIGSVCPLQYNCTNFFKRPKDKCFFQGTLYNSSQTIFNQEFLRVRDRECICFVDNGISRRFCYVIDCAEFFMEWPHPGCRRSYKILNQHCSDEICPPFTGLAQCVSGNKTYYEGEKFRPDNCSSCLCTKNGLSCQEYSCFVEDSFVEALDQKCAPVYQPSRCCPSEWTCFNKTQDKIFDLFPSFIQGPKCLYGNGTISKYGIMVKRLDATNGILCSCIVPPFLECRRVTGVFD